MKDKKKSSNQNRFESNRKDYDEREILMETLYNSRLTRDTTLKTAKTTNLISLLIIIGLVVYATDSILSFF